MDKKSFVTLKPRNSFLRKYISYYYFHSSFSKSLQKKFIYYPSYKNALTIYKNSKVAFGRNYSHVKPSPKNDFVFLYSGMQTHIRQAYISAPFDKIGIVFKALGINHFIKTPLSMISNDPIEKSFDYFGTKLKHSCKYVYSENKISNKVILLDKFFVNNFTYFPEETLKRAVEIIINSSQKLTVKYLCGELNTYREKLFRLFKKHLCCSIKDFIDIVQFRKALNFYLLENKKDSLTEVALENDYYDQAQFNTHFKKLTGVNPKRFFKEINHVGNEDTFWNFN